MTEVCINGHTRTEQNTSFVKCGRGEKRKRVCLDCRSEARRNGKPAAHEIQAQRTTELHEDVEDLLKFGATLEEIIRRGGFSSLKRLKTSLRRRERFDLLEKVEAKQEVAPNADLSVARINGNKYTGSGLSAMRTTRNM